MTYVISLKDRNDELGWYREIESRPNTTQVFLFSTLICMARHLSVESFNGSS